MKQQSVIIFFETYCTDHAVILYFDDEKKIKYLISCRRNISFVVVIGRRLRLHRDFGAGRGAVGNFGADSRALPRVGGSRRLVNDLPLNFFYNCFS